MKRRIPYGVGNYEKIVDENFYYVDKTAHIRELESVENPIFLRPRRFGKSLWCSTLECYYDINRKDRFAHLFGRTDIGRNPTPRRNSMLVLRFNFSTVNVGGTMSDIEKSFAFNVRCAVSVFAARYADYADFSPAKETDNAVDAMQAVLSIAIANGTPPVCVIIDEYDNFTNQLLVSSRDADYYAVTGKDSFLKNFYKTIKGGVEDKSIGFVFITGVLPITIDDLTSGFNIGRIITLDPSFTAMLGFTKRDVARYLDEIFADNGWSEALKERVAGELEELYDGYRMHPGDQEGLFNSTICNFYLAWLVEHDGQIPVTTVDENLKTDVNWIRRLSRTSSEALKIIERLVATGRVAFDARAIESRFKANQLLQTQRLKVALFYLGLVTYENEDWLRFPNATVQSVFTEYYNEIAEIVYDDDAEEDISQTIEAFRSTGDWASLYACFERNYLSRVPNQMYDKANENFFRTAFFFFCARRLASRFLTAIEVNVAAGGCADFVAVPRPDLSLSQVVVIEFKYYKRDEAKRLGVLDWTEPPAAVKEQVDAYAVGLRQMYPMYTVVPHIICIAGSTGHRFW